MSWETARGQSVFKSHILHSHVMLHFPGMETTHEFQLRDVQVRDPKYWGGQDQLGRQCLPVCSVPSTGNIYRGIFFLFLNKFQRPFYTVFIFKMSCHLEFFKIICWHFIIICVFKNFMWFGILCEFATVHYQKKAHNS